MTQHPIGYILNVIVGIATVAATTLFVGSLAVELYRRPRFSLRTLMIAMTVLAVLLGMATVTQR